MLENGKSSGEGPEDGGREGLLGHRAESFIKTAT